MMNKEINLFVPGRLCVFGEHSDWASKYRKLNDKIEKGYAIVTGIEEGISAVCSSCDDLVIDFLNDDSKHFSCEMNLNKLKVIAKEGKYWSYVAGVAAYIKERYNVSGLHITIKEITLPEKKGLSSSAAICVLVTRAFNQIYDLHINTIGEMDIAYFGEIMTPSKCGKLDQACAFGKTPVLMEFDGDEINTKNISLGSDFYFVFADLMASKDTIKILNDLNDSFPFPKNKTDENVIEGLGINNKDNVFLAVKYLEDGNNLELGKLMTKAQEDFDKLIAPKCKEELSSPILHSTLKDKNIKKLSYGGKGVGSQGDGTIQFLAKGEKEQQKLVEYLENQLHMNAYKLTLNKTKSITQAIIPVAGLGTRMYPMTKIISKAFLPVIDSDGIIKPSIMILLEELDRANIENIYLVVDDNNVKDFDKFFFTDNKEYLGKLSDEMLEYEHKIKKIASKIKYVYQKEKLGLGHAVSLCEPYLREEPVILLLGDQIYKTNSLESCTDQLINSYSKTNKLTVSVYNVPLTDVSKYGIIAGKLNSKEKEFEATIMYEKPTTTYAKENLFTLNYDDKKYYAVFGEYILTKEVFNVLRKNIKEDKKERGEFQLTSALEEVRAKDGMIAYITDGEMYDIGNIKSYTNVLRKY